MDSNLHPVMQQALRPFMPIPPADCALAAGIDFPIDSKAVAYHLANDARALMLQMRQPQTVEGWFV